jgi:hypothetical protein
MPRVGDKKKRKKRRLGFTDRAFRGQVGWICYGCERAGHVCILLSTVTHEIWFEPVIYPCDEVEFKPLTKQELKEWTKSARP